MSLVTAEESEWTRRDTRFLNDGAGRIPLVDSSGFVDVIRSPSCVFDEFAPKFGSFVFRSLVVVLFKDVTRHV